LTFGESCRGSAYIPDSQERRRYVFRYLISRHLRVRILCMQPDILRDCGGVSGIVKTYDSVVGYIGAGGLLRGRRARRVVPLGLFGRTVSVAHFPISGSRITAGPRLGSPFMCGWQTGGLSVQTEPLLLFSPAMWEPSGQSADPHVRRGAAACNGFDDARREEGKRREESDVTFDLTFSLGDFVEGCRLPFDEVAHPAASVGDRDEQRIAVDRVKV